MNNTNEYSDSDSEVENNETELSLYPEEEEMDDDFRAYIYSLTSKSSGLNVDDYQPVVKKKKKREKKVKEKKMVKIDFNNEINIPKTTNTWKSKRLTKKKPNIKEYKFKPKMVPYEYRFKEDNLNNNFKSLDNDTDFPSL